MVIGLIGNDSVQADELDLTETEAAPNEPFTLTAYWENDGGPLKQNNLTDRHYTNGLAVSLTHQPDWAHNLAPHMPFAEAFGEAQTGAGYIVGQSMFTPDDIEATAIIEDDRPYAAYLFTSVFWQRANDVTMDHLQFELGVVGPASQAGDLQVAIHELVDEDRPRGWKNQLGDEVTVQFHLRKKWRLNVLDHQLLRIPLQWQFIPQTGLALGTVHRHVDGGALLRVGGNLPDDFGPGRLADVGAATGTPNEGWGMYGFVRATGRLVDHNLFLEGNTFRDSAHTVNNERWGGEVQGGVSIQYHHGACHLEVIYSQTFISEEFAGQDGSNAYGGLSIALSVWY